MVRAVFGARAAPDGMVVAGVRMQDANGPERLRQLGERLDAARRANPPPREPQAGGDGSILQVALGLGMRLGIELVVAVGVGAGLGWAIDRWLGTKPWAMVLFLALGAATGIYNAWRAATSQGAAVGFRRGEANDKKSGEE